MADMILPFTLPFTLGEGELPPTGAPLPVVAAGGRPPLELHAELVYPDNTTVRWDKDASEAKDRPTGITFRTQRYTGFADAALTLNRRIDLDYPDLGLLDGINLIGHEGSVAYEGRVGTMPRNLSTGPSIGVQAQGWMSHARDQPFVEVYVDRDMSKWVAPSRRRVAAAIAANYFLGSLATQPDEAGEPTVELSFNGSWASPYKPLTEAWWLPQAGIQIGTIFYNFLAQTNVTLADTNWGIWVNLSSDDDFSALDHQRLTSVPVHGYLNATGVRTAAALQIYYEGTPVTSPNQTYLARFAQLAIYGGHALKGQIGGEGPTGFTVSEMMANIASRWAPRLDTSGIQTTSFFVPHASFISETLPYDAFQTLNAYHRWEMAVYEGRKLLYWPLDRNDWDWEVRLSDPGTTVSLQGDDSANLCNGVVVRYRDLNTGYETRLSPDVYPELRDLSPDNPANLNGLKLYTPMSISVPTTKEGALQMGRAFLAEFNESAAPGTITVTGHIRDRAGHWQQGWKVRASDRIVISDLPNDRVRVCGETQWNHDSKQLQISVDSSAKRLDAILARLGVAVEASNLALP